MCSGLGRLYSQPLTNICLVQGPTIHEFGSLEYLVRPPISAKMVQRNWSLQFKRPFSTRLERLLSSYLERLLSTRPERLLSSHLFQLVLEDTRHLERHPLLTSLPLIDNHKLDVLYSLVFKDSHWFIYKEVHL